ncbi:MAG: DUF1826 domain-containing protein [Pseudomonadota bacterium]
MNIATPISALQPVGVRVLRHETELKQFRDPACAAAIWDREVPKRVTDWLSALDSDLLPNARVISKCDAVKQIALEFCDIAGMPDAPERDWLIDDIALLAEMFSDLMQAPYMRLRLQAVTTNACRKFHRDALTGRLVCTYRGAGTQYGTSLNGEDPDPVFTTPTGAPILLRGSLWPPEPGAGLLHRSPPIEGTGETRLVLVLDPLKDMDAA